RSGSGGGFAAQEVEDAAELAVGISAGGFELDRSGGRDLLRVAVVELDTAELEPVDEQPHPVPAHRLDTAALQEVAELLHRVGPALHAEHPDLGPGVER